jgi:hypothetical protein
VNFNEVDYGHKGLVNITEETDELIAHVIVKTYREGANGDKEPRRLRNKSDQKVIERLCMIAVAQYNKLRKNQTKTRSSPSESAPAPNLQ